jgi:peptidoglycan hydrolase CwlO-like protein
MPEDRLQAVESTLAQVVAGQGQLEERQGRLEEGQGRLEERQGQLEERQGRLEGRQERLEATVAELRADTNRGFEDLGRQMRVLHESTIDHIKIVAERTEALRAEMETREVRILEAVDQRIRPLELTVRAHSADIAQLKKRRR